MQLRVAELITDTRHAGALEGAAKVGEAASDDRAVRIGVWLDGGRIGRAHFRASTCATLLVSAEAACRLLEAGADPRSFTVSDLRRALVGLHPFHDDRLELVARAVRAAAPEPCSGEQS